MSLNLTIPAFTGLLGALLLSGPRAVAAPAVMKPAGDWSVAVSYGTNRATFAVAPADVVAVADERLVLPLFDAKQPGYARGVIPSALRSYGISVNGALDLDTLSVRLVDGTRLERDRDYRVQPDWGCLSRLPGGRIGEGGTVLVSYRVAQRRLDSVVATAGGGLRLQAGRPALCLPRRPALAAGERAVGTVFVHGGQARLAEADLFPVLEETFTPPGGTDLPCTAAVKCPKTYAKLVAGEPVTILAWGDSVTDCAYLPRENRWQEQFVRRLRAKFPQAKVTLVTEGWGGRTVEAFLRQGKGQPHSWEDCVLGCTPKPDLVISEFINDAYLDNDEKVGRVYGRVLKDFRARGFEWIICTPHYARPDWNNLKSMKDCDDDPRGFTKSLRRFAARNGLAVADASRRWGHLWREGVPYITHLTNDINHPDAESLGYFADALMALFEGPAGPLLVVNEDNDHYFKLDAARMTKPALEAYVDAMAQGRVTHLFLCVNGQRASYDSKTWEPIWAGLDEPDNKGATNNVWCVNAKRLRDAGIDPYAVWVPRCRAKGISPWISMRMNDVHWSTQSNYFRNTTFCRTRADLWRVPHSTSGDWAHRCLDFAQREVRDYAFAQVKEIAERWDADGLELDWMRWGRNLRPGHEREDAHFITSFMRDTRRLLDEIGARRGRRIALGARVPWDPDVAQGVGLDAEAWAREGLVDLVVPHSFYKVDTGIAVGKWIARLAAANPRVTVLPGIDGVYDEPGGRREVSMTPETYRFVAGSFQAQGAKGVYLFNLPYLAKRGMNGEKSSLDVPAVIYREGLSPAACARGPSRPIATRHDF